VSGDDCKDCVYVKSCDRRVGELEAQYKALEGRITVLERFGDATKERLDMLFEILADIKQSIYNLSASNQRTFEQLAARIERFESRPGQLYQTILTGIITAVVTALLIAGLKGIGVK